MKNEFYGLPQNSFPDLEERFYDMSNDLLSLHCILSRFSDDLEDCPPSMGLLSEVYRYLGVFMDYAQKLDGYAGYIGDLSRNFITLPAPAQSSGDCSASD